MHRDITYVRAVKCHSHISGCLMAAVHLVGAGTVLPAVSRGHCGFRLMGCHLCPSYGCCPWCSIQAVICPGGTGSSSRWHGRWWSEKLEKHFDVIPGCPSSFTRVLSRKGEGELDPCPPNDPSSRGILPPRKQVISLLTHLPPVCSNYSHMRLTQPIRFLTTTSYD